MLVSLTDIISKIFNCLWVIILKKEQKCNNG